MKKAVVYIHGKGGSAAEAEHYKLLFPDCSVIGFDYKAETPWEAKAEFSRFFDEVSKTADGVILIANSIGAYFAMNADIGKKITKAFFISPVVDMERIITEIMAGAGVTEDELRRRGEVKTDFGETLSWKYLCFARENPLSWSVPTHILRGENDFLTPLEVMSAFAEKIGAGLTVMPGGKHWFHTEEQMEFLDNWIAE